MIALKLLSLEWFKARHRAVFWITLGFFMLLVALLFGIAQLEHARNPRADALSLPGDWLAVLSGPAELAPVLVVTVLALLVASERTWRTQRQNVIDGLSRTQYFSGKLLLSLLVVCLFWITPLLLALGFALFDGAPGFTDGTGPFLPARVQLLLGAQFLSLAGMASIALLFGIVASSSGAALALAFVFMVAQPPIGMLIARWGDAWAEIGRRFPVFVFGQITDPTLYDAAARAASNARVAEDARLRVTALLSPLEAHLFALGYTLLFVGIAWLAFRRRDL